MPQTPDALMLFAAGFGSRMGSLTADRPKPLIPVAGLPLLDHALSLIDGLPLSYKVANIHYLPDQIAAHLAHRPDIALSRETPAILETGGGLRQALPKLGPMAMQGGPVFTLNSDAVWSGPNPLVTLRDGWDGSRMEALLLLLPAACATGHTGPGDFGLAPDGRISRGDGRVQDMVYLGAQIIRTAGLASFAEPAYSLNRLWDRMIAAGRAFGLPYPGRWCDVGWPDGIALAEHMLSQSDV